MAGRKEWDPRGSYRKIPAFEEMAQEYIGDGKRPNLYFVFARNSIVLISQEFSIAYQAWKDFSKPPYEDMTALEDRLVGVLAAVEPDSDEPGAQLVKIDNTHFLMDRS